MKNVSRYLVVVTLLLATPALFAQARSAGIAGGARMGGAGVRGAHMGGGTAHGGIGSGHGFRPARPGLVGGFHHRGFRNNRFSPFWGNAFWWDDGLYPEDDGTQVVIQQQPAAASAQPAAVPVQEVKPANPLLIELQGDRFVRMTGNPPLTTSSGTSTAQPQAELPPAVLIFRDGHRQEVSSYSIIGPALYASGSYWTTGYWTQKILLADLDLPATLRANQERGVNFVLPSAPNQVVTRP
ncbi:MAG TPA: hypothetical protein VKT29_14445 [Terriglobales bacterium]|nr:hypothetical protein [Terriglobales bacterium]